MKTKRLFYALLCLGIALGHQFLNQYQLATAENICHEEQQSCIWFQQSLTASSSPFALLLPFLPLLVITMAAVMIPERKILAFQLLRIQDRQRSRILRE